MNDTRTGTERLTAGGLLTSILVIALIGPALASPRISCHIHPPAALTERQADASAGGQATVANPPPQTIGPFSERDQCEAARRRLFGELGRCHCVAAFSHPTGPARAPTGLSWPLDDAPLP